MDALFLQITPEMASKWIESSKGNPRWARDGKIADQKRVSQIAEDIKSGNWNPGNNSIAFDEEGVLVDGHHRLCAIVKAGIPVKSLVVYGIEKTGLQHIDENRPRCVSQRLNVDSQVVAAANFHFWMMNSLTKASETSEVISKWIELHPDIYTALSLVRQGGRHAIAKKACVVHGTLCALECGVDENIISKFMESVNSGFISDLSESPAIVLRNMLIKPYSKARSMSVLLDCSTQNAISDYVLGVPRKKAYSIPHGVYFDSLVKEKRKGYVK